jgi:hypothetical protein
MAGVGKKGMNGTVAATKPTRAAPAKRAKSAPGPAAEEAVAISTEPAPVAEVAKAARPAPRKRAQPADESDAAPVTAAPATPPAPAKIFQIFFDAWQRPLVDPLFVPLDNSGPPTEHLEFDLFERLSISEHVKDVPLWGALSWRFTEKTGVSGADLFRIIKANPGHDIYFCNALPQHEALYHNLWVQGETAHPRFLELVRAFLKAAGLPDDTRDLLPSSYYSTANYFVGSPAFWSAYLPFVRGALIRADRDLPPELREVLHSTAADDRNVHGGSTYMPFIVERLFPLFMRTAGKGLKPFKLPLTLPEEEMNVHLKLLREMKDAAWRNKSLWLAACWVNYRNLYLSQQHGHDWTRRFLRNITPPEIKFA